MVKDDTAIDFTKCRLNCNAKSTCHAFFWSTGCVHWLDTDVKGVSKSSNKDMNCYIKSYPVASLVDSITTSEIT